MKKIISATLALAILLATLLTFTSCGKSEKINVGVMNGPTGMGMAKLINDAGKDSELYGFHPYADPQVATADLANGTLDMLCLPTNTAANLSIKEEDFITVIAINTLGSLYLLTDADTKIESIDELEGATIYTSVKNSTTRPILEYVLESAGVNATINDDTYADHDSLTAAIKDNEVAIAVLPEPKATAAIINNGTYSIDLNISEEWDKISDEPLAMGCIVVRNDFLEDNKSEVDAFLAEYKKSIEYINDKANLESSVQMIVGAGIIPKAPVAKKALGNLYGSIVYIDGADMKSALKKFYTAIGNNQPSDEFYYEK